MGKNTRVCIKLNVSGIGSQDKITCDFFFLNLSRKFDRIDPRLSGRQLVFTPTRTFISYSCARLKTSLQMRSSNGRHSAGLVLFSSRKPRLQFERIRRGGSPNRVHPYRNTEMGQWRTAVANAAFEALQGLSD